MLSLYNRGGFFVKKAKRKGALGGAPFYTVCVTINFRGVWGSGPCIRQGDLLYVITHEEHIDAGLQEIKSNENTGENSC